ncbi:MAG TPA: PHP domain-containing protein [archaeon]|nr:PHP domain-containing protein [archaeon]
MIDLHMHTTASDGRLSPQELVDLAVRSGLKAIAITDHDAVSGIAQASEHAKRGALEVIPGIEINCAEKKLGFSEIEVVGLFINPENKNIAGFARAAKLDRIEQKKKSVKKLQRLGFEISFEELKSRAKGSLGFPHIAGLLLEKYPEKFSSIKDVFDKYLRAGKPAFVDRQKKPGIKQAISIIKKSGGLAFLAHPGIFSREDSLRAINFFQGSKGDGIETYYPYHLICSEKKISEKENLALINFFRGTAKSLGLLESGGSDFHGGDRQTINAVGIPDSVLEKLRESLKRRLVK